MTQPTRIPIPLTREARQRLPDVAPARPGAEPSHDMCNEAARRSPAVDPPIIAVRHVRAGGRLVPVELIQNEGGSVAARFLIDSADTPVIDAPSADEALATVEEVIEGILFARRYGN